MRLEYKALPLVEMRASEDGGEFEGIGSAFYLIDDSWTSDIVAPGAFAEDLPEFLARGFVGGMNHDWDEPIGKPLAAEERPEGLWVRAAISDTQAGRDTRTLIRDGVVRFLSVGFRVLARRYLETADEVRAWWQAHGYEPTAEDVAKSVHGARVLERVRLYEVSPVAVPANRGARITGVKASEDRGGPLAAGAHAGVGGRWSMAEHSGAALALGEELAERLEQLRALRAGEGRDLSPDHGVALRRLRDRLDRIERAIRVPTQTPLGDPARKQFARFQAMEARRLGAPVE